MSNQNNDGPLPSSASLLKHAPPSIPSTNTLPSARSLGLEFPWHGGNKKPSLPSFQSSMPVTGRIPQTNSISPFQQLPPSTSLPNALSLPSSNSIPKSFQNTPLQGLRTSNLGKRYMDDQQSQVVLLFM